MSFSACHCVDITVSSIPRFLINSLSQSHMGEIVYSFGHMLYEMLASSPLNKASIDVCPSSFPSDLGNLQGVVCISD